MSSIVAEVKKKENIAEYIVYMYQIEDLILSYDFNLDDIFKFVIKHMSQDEKVLKENLLWYADIIERMRKEKITSSTKRLSSTQYYLEQLTQLHEKHMIADVEYKKLYTKAEKDILSHITRSGNSITNPVLICINGIYGMLLLNLNGKKIAVEVHAKIKKFGKVLGYLSQAYKEQVQASK